MLTARRDLVRRRALRPVLAAAALLGVTVLACSRDTAEKAAPPRVPEQLVVRVLRSYPHDPEAFTQGLVYTAGQLYESTGRLGRSSLRRVRLEDGAVEASVALPPELFGEGLAQVGDRLVQLTWKNGIALVWEVDGLRRAGAHPYTGEGWGLCHDGHRLVMSSGSDRLVFRDPATFLPEGELAVVNEGRPVANLNELECTRGVVYANIWREDRIARIDPRTGQVTAWIDAAGLLPAEHQAAADVLNGIAYVPERDTFLVTGKLWPQMFEVKFEPRAPR